MADIADFDPWFAKALQKAEIDDEEFTSVQQLFDKRLPYRNVRVQGKQLRAFDLERIVILKYFDGDDSVIKALRKGFFNQFPFVSKLLLSKDEVISMLLLPPQIDVQDWKQHTQVATSIKKKHPHLVDWLFEILQSDADLAKRTLQFSTGMKTPPLGGFS